MTTGRLSKRENPDSVQGVHEETEVAHRTPSIPVQNAKLLLTLAKVVGPIQLATRDDLLC